jgi:hypothetical protein
MAAGPRGVGQQGREPLDPPVDGDVVDLDAALGEQLLHVAVRQREAQLPAHGQHDHVWREAEPNERRPCDRSGTRAASSHGDSLPTLGSTTAGATVPATVLGAVTPVTGLPGSSHQAFVLKAQSAAGPSQVHAMHLVQRDRLRRELAINQVALALALGTGSAPGGRPTAKSCVFSCAGGGR